MIIGSCKCIFFLIPSEYFAFLGDEIIMYCCSGGLVVPLEGVCFGD